MFDVSWSIYFANLNSSSLMHSQLQSTKCNNITGVENLIIALENGTLFLIV